MKRIKPILLSGVVLTSGCQHTYESFVREEMKIPNVFVPSSDEVIRIVCLWLRRVVILSRFVRQQCLLA